MGTTGGRGSFLERFERKFPCPSVFRDLKMAARYIPVDEVRRQVEIDPDVPYSDESEAQISEIESDYDGGSTAEESENSEGCEPVSADEFSNEAGTFSYQ